MQALEADISRRLASGRQNEPNEWYLFLAQNRGDPNGAPAFTARVHRLGRSRSEGLLSKAPDAEGAEGAVGSLRFEGIPGPRAKRHEVMKVLWLIRLGAVEVAERFQGSCLGNRPGAWIFRRKKEGGAMSVLPETLGLLKFGSWVPWQFSQVQSSPYLRCRKPFY